MKRFLLTTMVMLLGLVLNAQVSVWDGTVEPWDTMHAGTEEDPILIENAAQFASLQQNPGLFKYYRLMTDIDLDNRIWYPIGFSDITYRPFKGYLDGNGHTIYHLTRTLFGDVAYGYIKNLTIKDSDIIVDYGLHYFSSFAYYVPLIENCHNYGTVYLEYEDNDPAYDWWNMGGVVSSGGTVTNCSNHGNLVVNTNKRLSYLKIGGIAGTAGAVEESYNTGNITINSEINSFCYIGGICGEIGLQVSHCYNTGDMSISFDASYVGGLVGNATNDQDIVSISACYNAGNIEASNIGGIIAKTDNENVVITVDNCYYINTITSGNDYGIPKPESEMKTQGFVDLLNADGNFYAMDDMNVNHGYPIFAKYYAVEENAINSTISIYPNPAKDVVSVSFTQNTDCSSIEIYSIDGRMVKSQNSDFEKINISHLPAGLYIMRVILNDGTECTERIVKE